MRTKIILAVALTIGIASAAGYSWFVNYGQTKRFEASGTIEATEINVGSETGGKITRLYVGEGERVTDGRYLLRTEDEVAKSQLRQAEAQLEAATVKYDRAKNAGQTEQKATKAELTLTQAGVDIAETRLAATKVKAPISGEVLTLPFTEGEIAGPGATVAVLADLAELKVTVYIPETRLGQVKLRDRANVRVDSYPGRVFVGRVVKVSDTAEFTPTNIETKDQRVKLVYAVTIKMKNTQRRLKPGMPADVDFPE